MIFRWVFSKLGAAAAAVLALVGIYAWGKHQQVKRQQAEAEKVAAEGRADVAETTVEVKEEEETRHEAVEQASPDKLIHYWGDREPE